MEKTAQIGDLGELHWESEGDPGWKNQLGSVKKSGSNIRRLEEGTEDAGQIE
jgi:hypothetical protein